MLNIKVEWVLATNEQFSVNSAWNALRVHHPIVQWHNIVWHKDSVPRCSFVLRLVCRDRIRTKDKLLQWGCVNEAGCILCGNAT